MIDFSSVQKASSGSEWKQISKLCWGLSDIRSYFESSVNASSDTGYGDYFTNSGMRRVRTKSPIISLESGKMCYCTITVHFTTSSESFNGLSLIIKGVDSINIRNTITENYFTTTPNFDKDTGRISFITNVYSPAFSNNSIISYEITYQV